jgi:hypothetical protein
MVRPLMIGLIILLFAHRRDTLIALQQQPLILFITADSDQGPLPGDLLPV